MEHKHQFVMSVTSCDDVHLEHYQHRQEKTTILLAEAGHSEVLGL
jgi:hypothetical protein